MLEQKESRRWERPNLFREGQEKCYADGIGYSFGRMGSIFKDEVHKGSYRNENTRKDLSCLGRSR